MEKFMKKSEEKGITLIALIITIIVLIILAGISIMMISGQDGILQRAGNAKTTIGQASAEEAVKRAILSLQIDGKGSNNGITPAKIAEQVNKDNSRSDVVAEGDTFPTNIKFVKDKIDVYVNLDLTIGEHNDTVAPGLYPIDNISESQIAPDDLFEYEPITTTGANNTKIASTNSLDNLPKKKIKITGIKEKYLNKQSSRGLENGFYGITYKNNNFALTDTLVIPSQVKYEGEMYTVTEVDLTTQVVDNENKIRNVTLPNIGYIIYPNTVTKLGFNSNYRNGPMRGRDTGNFCIQKCVILPSSLEEIPSFFFQCTGAQTIIIPTSVIKISEKAFDYTKTTINYMGTKEQWDNIIKENGAIDYDVKVNYNYDINTFEKNKKEFTSDEEEKLKELEKVFIKANNYMYGRFDKDKMYTSIEECTGYKTFKDYFVDRVLISVEKYYDQYFGIWYNMGNDFDIIVEEINKFNMQTNENEKWDKLTEIFIQGENYQMIANGEISNDTKFTSLQDVWSAWKDAGIPDNTKYNTLKEFYESEIEPTGYYSSIEAFMAGDFLAIAKHKSEENTD
mgnify:FL=1